MKSAKYSSLAAERDALIKRLHVLITEKKENTKEYEDLSARLYKLQSCSRTMLEDLIKRYEDQSEAAMDDEDDYDDDEEEDEDEEDEEEEEETESVSEASEDSRASDIYRGGAGTKTK